MSLMQTLSRGDRGGAVLDIQARLGSLGHPIDPNEHGNFGPSTEVAVRTFQERRHLIVDGIVEPMELGHLPYKKKTFEDYVSEPARKRRGKKKWLKDVFDVVERLETALEPDYIVIGGGGVNHLDEMPPNARRGGNEAAFTGGFRLWEPEWSPRPGAGEPS